MNLELSNTDILFIYSHFINDLKSLEEKNKNSATRLDKTSLNREKKLYLSVIEKIRAQHPNLIEMDKFW